MENSMVFKKSVTLSEHKHLSFGNPSVSNLLSCNKSKKNDLKKILFKTPSKNQLEQSAKKKTPHAAIINDRYIPNRVGSNIEVSHYLFQNAKENQNSKENNTASNTESTANNNNNNNTAESNDNLIDNIKRRLIIDTCNGIPEKSKVLNLHNKQADSSENCAGFGDNIKMYNPSVLKSVKKTINRVIPTVPDRILDAPDFRDDYYLNLIDWSSSNLLSVALNKEMYIWNASNGEISQLFSLDEDESNSYISSCAWIQNNGNILAVGNSKNSVELWDVVKERRLRDLKSHDSRVGALSWNHHILTSGSRTGYIHHHDVRVQNHHVATLRAHDQDVCGLKWSPDGRFLASGSNDNLAIVWDLNMYDEYRPMCVFREHKAAVKAVAWCPWQSNVLATGGGTADGKINIWNVYNGNVIHSQDAKSQISCILWSKQHKELISSHGYQLNQLSLWKYPEMSKVCDLTGHYDRVLMMAMSPDEEMVVSAGADETLRLWRCFGVDEKQKKSQEILNRASIKSASQSSLSRCIR